VSWEPSRANGVGRIAMRTRARRAALRGSALRGSALRGSALRGSAVCRAASLLLVAGLLFFASACGRAQTSQPYTPGEGVNVDIGNPANPNDVVHVRNLAIISWAPGEGVVSGSIVTAGRDSLTAVTGVPIKADGTEGAPFTGTIPSTVSVANGLQVVLTDQPPIVVKSPDIMAGLDAIVTLQFANAGEVTTRAPILDGNVAPYQSLKPSEAPSP